MTYPGPVVLRAKVLTVSTGVAGGTRPDTAGPKVVEVLGAHGFTVVDHLVVADGTEPVSAALRAAASGFAGLILTTGGTGFSPDDLTPEATAEVIDRAAPGLAEAMRAAGPLGRLTRGVAGLAGACVICNLPGSLNGACAALEAVIDVLPHALALAAGERPH